MNISGLSNSEGYSTQIKSPTSHTTPKFGMAKVRVLGIQNIEIPFCTAAKEETAQYYNRGLRGLYRATRDFPRSRKGDPTASVLHDVFTNRPTSVRTFPRTDLRQARYGTIQVLKFEFPNRNHTPRSGDVQFIISPRTDPQKAIQDLQQHIGSLRVVHRPFGRVYIATPSPVRRAINWLIKAIHS